MVVVKDTTDRLCRAINALIVMDDLPIEIVHGTDPPRFYWQQQVDGRTVNHSGVVSSTMEMALAKLIFEARRLTKENAELRGKLMEQANTTREVSKNVPTPVSSSKKVKV